MNTSPSMPAAESAGDPRHDVVPGFPPVPITIWRTPYQQGDTYPYPSALAQRIVATFSRPGDTVADLTGGLLAAACAASGRAHHLAGPQAAMLPEASLVVVDWAAVSASPGRGDAGIAAVLQAARRALHPGGHLVVLTPATAGAGTGPAARHLVAGCLGTGLTYLQNIIALRADITHGRMVAHPLDLAAGTADTAVKVHADLFVFTAQATGPAQRAGRYTPESVQHPARMLPAIAWHAIGAYTRPGDIVLDPMAGVGTTIVEAMHAGRDGIGVEYEAQWADQADANVRLAASQHAPGRGMIIRGDGTRLTSLLPAAVHGKAALVVTSPPYGPAVHGQVRPGPGGVAKAHGTYGAADRRRGNLAHQSQGRLMASFTEILRGSAAMLRPGGVVVVTTRPYRVDGSLVDLPGEVETAGIAAGLVPAERCVALLAAVRDQRIVARPSFFQLGAARKAQLAGIPQHLIAHEDVCVLVKPHADGRVVAPATLAQGVGR